MHSGTGPSLFRPRYQLSAFSFLTSERGAYLEAAQFLHFSKKKNKEKTTNCMHSLEMLKLLNQKLHNGNVVNKSLLMKSFKPPTVLPSS